MWIIQMIFAPQMADAYMQLLDKYMGTKMSHIEQYEEEMDDIPVKPLPEPKTNQKEDSETEEKPQPEDNMKPVERKEPIKELPPPAKRPRPEELI